MTPVHIVWDWNGTLLNDLNQVVQAVSRSVSRYGLGPISHDDYRDHYTRPVRNFYNSMFAREVTDMEWADLNKTFHDTYYSMVDGIPLADGAVESLRAVADLGWSQSLLSMSTHDHLVRTVKAHGIADHFDLVEGLREADGSNKAIHMKVHLESLSLGPSAVYVIGDTPDDHDAAVFVGARPLMFDGGSHHREVLEGTGAPVVGSLGDAVTMIREETSA